MDTSELNVAFLGLGTMGAGMAARLAGAGFRVTVWNRTPGRGDALRRSGASFAPSPREAAAGAHVVISMVADDPASRELWTAADGALAGARPDAVLIECSTLSPAWVRELAELAAARGCAFLDAPVTGSRVHAANGELVFLVGGYAGVLDRVRPVLKAMSRDIVHLGPTGSGAVMKLVNNFMAAVQVASVAEALAFAGAAGLDVNTAMSIVGNGAPGSPIVKWISERMLARNYDVNFKLSLVRKDMTYAVAEAEGHGVPLTMAAAARALFDGAVAAGYGDQDFAAVAETIRRAT